MQNVPFTACDGCGVHAVTSLSCLVCVEEGENPYSCCVHTTATGGRQKRVRASERKKERKKPVKESAAVVVVCACGELCVVHAWIHGHEPPKRDTNLFPSSRKLSRGFPRKIPALLDSTSRAAASSISPCLTHAASLSASASSDYSTDCD